MTVERACVVVPLPAGEYTAVTRLRVGTSGEDEDTVRILETAVHLNQGGSSGILPCMKNFLDRIPPFTRFVIATTALFVVTFSLFRLAFWIAFRNPTDPLPLSLLSQSLYLGLKFDLRLTLVLLLPILAFSWIRPVHLLYSRFGKYFWNGYITIMLALIFLIYLFDVGHFAYLHTHLEATAVGLLEDTAISVEMLWETYPILRVVFAFITAIAFYSYSIQKLIQKYAAMDPISLNKKQKTITVLCTLFLVLLGLYGKLSYYPLRWSDAFYSTNGFASAVAINPVHYLMDTFRAGQKKPYDEKIVREHYDEVAAFLGVAEQDRKPFNYTREIRNDGGIMPSPVLTAANGSGHLAVVVPLAVAVPPAVVVPPNIVLVQLESFSYEKTGLYGSALNPTPYFNDLAKSGLFFNNYFAPHVGTARAVFTAVTGIPDVETHNTSTRNPVIICQHTIINAFQDYDKFYFLGGSASWGNIRGLLSNNIHNLKIHEEGMFRSPRVDVWGISDLALFEEANHVLKQRQEDKMGLLSSQTILPQRPFFAIIQTAGNHRPYTIPKDNRGFQTLSPTAETLKKNGFESAEELNAMRFMDHSIAVFMETAKKERYFDNTIFVFFGDHGTTAGGGDVTLRWESHLNLTGFHVPFLIYAPKLIPENKVDTSLAGHPDILPTLAGFTHISYKNTTMGRDLLDPKLSNRRVAFTITHGTRSEIGLLEDDYYFLMHDNGTNKRLQSRHTDNSQEDLLLKLPQEAAQMERLLIGLYETSKYMLYHNNDCQ